ncbi:hypothetical protein AB6A40_008301 [Gnathostoma spinigerum]|uniref:CAP-Gly domain-containing protein n=1 Tax=Gnathostoma spinigerum TaxID=75299 RepID=A0ABD6EYA9_9BILA
MTEGITRTTSRESLVSSLSITGEWAVGDRCRIDVRTGSIVFIGPTHFAPGQWIGVVLDQPEGKNDGCVDGRRYFKVCLLAQFFSPFIAHLYLNAFCNQLKYNRRSTK